jgi:putative ABC transport system permease protein
MSSFVRETLIAWRTVRKSYVVSIAALLTIAIGVGSVTAVFSVVEAVLLKPLPYPDSRQLVTIWRVPLSNSNDFAVTSLPEALDWQDSSRSFSGLAPFTEREYTLLGTDEPLNVHGVSVSANIFQLLGVSPSLGRGFLPNEDKFGSLDGSNPVVLSQSFWKQQLGSDPQVVGRRIQLNGDYYTVIGVMPSGFAFPVGVSVDLWTTLAEFHKKFLNQQPVNEQRGVLLFETMARLKPGVTIAQAQQEMKNIQATLVRKYPQYGSDVTVRLLSAIAWVAGEEYGRILWIFMAAVGCIFLIATVNVMGLQLARQSERRRDTAIRLVLGANRLHIFRQLLAEGMILSLIGGAAGIGLAYLTLPVLKHFVPQDIPRLAEARIDGSVLLFTFAVAALASMVFTIGPLIHTGDLNADSVLKQDNTRAAGTGIQRRRLLGALMIVEVALTLFLLASANLLLRTVVKARVVDLGFKDDGVLTFKVALSNQSDRPSQARFFAQLLEQVRALPGVESAGSATSVPLTGDALNVGVILPGKSDSGNAQANIAVVEPGYFQTLLVNLRGRDFMSSDSAGGQPVIIVNEAFGRMVFGAEDSLGKQIEPTVPAVDGEYKVRTVIGVARNLRSEDPWKDGGPAIYVPESQVPFNSMTFVVRTKSDPLMLLDAIRRQAKILDQSVPVSRVKLLHDYVREKFLQPEFSALLLVIFASIALVLTIVAVYAMVAYSVLQRRHEIGIRMALGATSNGMLLLIVRQTMALVAVGLLGGLVASVLASRVLGGILFVVKPADPLALAASFLCVSLSTLVACVVPARKIVMMRTWNVLHHE